MKVTRHTQTALLVFAKAPVAGQAKTRLTPRLGADGAARFQAALTRHTLHTACTAFPDTTDLYGTPAVTDPWFQCLATSFPISLHTQQGADLGERMHQALSHALQTHPRALLIGTDCPVLTVDQLLAAEAALTAGAETVVTPAEDGGYVLIGLSKPFLDLFANIAWGTPRVFPETQRRLARRGHPVRIMPPLWDIDEPADLDRLDRQDHTLCQQLTSGAAP